MIIVNENFKILTEHIKGFWESDNSDDSCDFELIITTNSSFGMTRDSIIVIAPSEFKDQILKDWLNSIDA